MSRWCCIFLLALVGFRAAPGQTPLSAYTLSGTVFDQDEAVLSKAKVTLKGSDKESGLSRARSATTDASGAFRFEKLAAGSYEILVEREGFKTTTVPVTVGARAPAPLRIVLPVAEVQQDI